MAQVQTVDSAQGQAETRYIVAGAQLDCASATLNVHGPAGHFEGLLLLSTRYTMELYLPQHRADQIGLTKELFHEKCQRKDGSFCDIACRGAATVKVASSQSAACLEAWTDDEGTPQALPPRAQPSVHSGDQVLRDVAANTEQRFRSFKKGQAFDGIIGRPGMLKLCLGIDAQSGDIYAVKRVLRK